MLEESRLGKEEEAKERLTSVFVGQSDKDGVDQISIGRAFDAASNPDALPTCMSIGQ